MSTQLTSEQLPIQHNLVDIGSSPEIEHRPMAAIKKEFHDTIKKLSYSRHTWQVWEDFCEIGALALANSTLFSETREARYMDTIARYDPEEVHLFPRLLGMVTEALEVEFQDFLGQIFMELEMGSKWHGQFFTPYPVSQMMSQMTLTPAAFEEKYIVEMNEPAAGAGAMCIALCEHVRKNLKINYQDRLRIIAQDVDRTAAHMCYIQLSLIGAQARVVWGNTLTVEAWNVYVTPFAVMKGWFN